MSYIKVLGIVGTVLSIGSNLLLSWVGDKNVDNKITVKVSEILKKNES